MNYKNLSHSLYIIELQIMKIFGQLNWIVVVWWGIKLGRGALFLGRCYFKRQPGSEVKIGKNCHFLSRSTANLIGINRPCIISTNQSNYKAKIEIGDNCGFSGTVIGAFKSIKLGNDVRCGANTLITDCDWHLDDFRSNEPKDVSIGNNVWLGVNSVVLKGVSIGDNTIIGANSVVVNSIPSDVIAAGNPCKVIKSIDLKKHLEVSH